jgi:hypothetical protein
MPQRVTAAPSPLVLSGRKEHVGSLSLWERVGVRVAAPI